MQRRAVSGSAETCPVCGSPEPVAGFEKDGYPIRRCRGCETVFCLRRPGPDELKQMYSAEYFTKGGVGYPGYLEDEHLHRRQARLYLRRLRRHGARPGALLDIGCAAGFFLDEARQDGWTVRGCEIGDYVRQHALSLGLDIAASRFIDTAYAPASFDVITAFNVFEHLPNPVAVAARMFTLLKPGGRVAIETWDPDSLMARLCGQAWQQFAPPHVLFWFNRRSLQAVFRPDRWRLASYRPAFKWISLRHAAFLLAHRAERPLAGALRAAGRSPVGRLAAPYFLGDLTFAVFERREAS